MFEELVWYHLFQHGQKPRSDNQLLVFLIVTFEWWLYCSTEREREGEREDETH